VHPLFTDFSSPENSGNKEKHVHEQEGIFIAWGANIKRGHESGAKSIFDVAPTMLYALGLPLTDHFDGKAMWDMFEGSFTKKYPVEIYASYLDLDFLDYLESGEFTVDRTKLEEQMRALGYIE